ncbi:MAG TPA: hypothetical protein VL588_13285 [Bdellovibrionota bacterium]|nr:hypothetical protein [Bdellovibrionota bacterium]
MNIASKTTLALIALLSSVQAWAHPQEARVAVELESADHAQAGAVQVDFDLLDLKKKIVLKDTDLEVTHEKLLHCFVYDPALKEFRHEHPTFDGSMWHFSTDLPVDGNYWVFFQGQLASDHSEFAASTRILVSGGQPANADEPELGDVRTGADGISVATLSNTALNAGQTAMLTLAFSRNDGTAPVITPFLGEQAHIVITPSDGDSLIHVHPMVMGGKLMIHVAFPEEGDYRVWVQFMDGGTLRTVPLSVTVN